MQLYNRNYIIAKQLCVCSLLIIYTHSKEMTSQSLFGQWSVWNGMQSEDRMRMNAKKQPNAELVTWPYFRFNQFAKHAKLKSLHFSSLRDT